MKRYIAGLLLLVMLLGMGARAEPGFSASYAPSEALSSAWTSVTHSAMELEDATEATPFSAVSELMENPGGAEVSGDLATDDVPEADWLSDSATLQSDAMVAYQNEAAERYRLDGERHRHSRSGGARMSLNELRAKFPSGKYWNHAHNPGLDKKFNNADGWTDVPCPENHSESFLTEMSTCNAYWPGQGPIGFQCYGFADKLGLDATGTDPETWEKREYSGALNSLKAGDIVRFLNDKHSIFVIDVDGEEVTYADCNSGGTCVIRWNQSTTKSRLAETFTYVMVCPTDDLVDDGYCHCSANLSGVYTANQKLPIYKAHRLGGETVGYMEGGTGTCRVDFIGWETPTCQLLEITATGSNDGKLVFNMVDDKKQLYATCELPYTITTTRTYLTASRNALRINADQQPSQTIRLTAGGFLPGEFSLVPLRTTNDITSLDWAEEWDGYSCDLTITGVLTGDSKIIIGLLGGGVIRATTEIDVSVSGTAYITAEPERVILNLEGAPERLMTYTLTGMLPPMFDFRITQISAGIEIINITDLYAVDGGFAVDVKVIGHDVVRGSVVTQLKDYRTGAVVSTHALPVEIYRKSADSAELKLPRLRRIESESFRNIAARSVWVPDGATYIGKQAFAGNGQLWEIYLPDSLVDIAADAFEGCDNLTILAPLGSAAETFALDKGFAYIPAK